MLYSKAGHDDDDATLDNLVVSSPSILDEGRLLDQIL